MKPFDLQRAIAGDPVYMEARHTGWNYVGPVFFVGVSENDLPVVEIDAKPTRVSPEYLRMAPKKRTVYVNLYDKTMRVDAAWHHTEANALEASSMWTRNILARAVPIEIED